MKTYRAIRSVLLAGAMTAAFAVPAFAQNFDVMPKPVNEGSISYLTGGIGADEQQAIQSEAKNYDLLITSSNPTGHFTADTNFVIRSKDGRQMISAENAGPLFYAQLPPGEYTITATNGGQQEVRKVRISADRENRLAFIWRES